MRPFPRMLMVGEFFFLLATVGVLRPYCTPCLFFRRKPLRFSLELSFVAVYLAT